MSWIGSDESGKGDYFGYLVVAAVRVEDEEKLLDIGVRDSKLISDMKIHKLASEIMKLCDFEIVKISPSKYNMIYPKFSNLNDMLAWAHGKAIKNLYNGEKIIIDKFSSDAVMKKYLDVDFSQKIKAESDTAVACASIVARSVFLKTLRMLGKEIGIVLPKGSVDVKDTVKEIINKYDKEALSYVAKMHFKIKDL